MKHESQNEKRPIGSLIKQILRKIFLEDWLIKAVALAVTLALWIGVTGLSTPTTTRISGVPLTLRFSSDVEVTNPVISEVNIVITGDKRKVNQINKNDLIVSIDLTDMPPGDRVIKLTPEAVSLELPTGVKLDEIQPNQIPVRLETVEEKDIEVKVETAGEPAEGYEVYEAAAAPARVRVRGPASYVRALAMVSTEKVSIAGRSEDVTVKQAGLNLASASRALLLQTTVDVTVRIGERRMERIYLVPLGDGSGKRATVVLYGPRSVMLGIGADELKIETVPGENGLALPQLILPPEAQGRVEIRKLDAGR